MKNFKKILSVLMIILLVTTAVPLSSFVGIELPAFDLGIRASAKEVPASGSCGTNVTYTYDSVTKELVISGTGSMTSYSDTGNSPFYGSDIKSVVISEGITSIGSYIFTGCQSLESVTVPGTVKTIGSDAFYGCKSIKNITIPYGVETISNGAFYNCSSLETITIPDSVRTISWSVFYNCTSLESVTIPDSVTSIDYSAFHNCTSLASVTIPDSVTSISYNAFYNCTSLESVTIPDSVTLIGSNAFQNCTSLTSVTIGDSVTSIYGYTFYNCTSLTSVTIPDSVTSIGNSAFSKNTMLIVNKDSYVHSWAVNNAHPYYIANPDTAEDNIISEVVNTKLSYSIDKLTRTLTINNQGSMVTFSSYDAPWKQHYGYVYHVVINDGCECISERAFCEMHYVKDIVMPDTIKSIGNSAFYNCDELTEIDIPDAVTSIGNDAFCDCDELTEIDIPDAVTSIGQYAFRDCDCLEIVALNDGLKSIGQNAFMSCDNLKNIVIPDSVTSISYNAFQNCTSLESVKIGSGLIYIYNSMFEDCSSLKDVIIGDNIRTIYGQAFSGCSSLEKVILPESVTTISSAAFSGSGLRKIYIRALSCSIAENAIYYRASIYGFNDSNVKTFAEKYGYNFVSLDIGDHEHEFTEWVPQPNATCTEDGMMVRRCEICGEREEEVIPATGHNYIVNVIAPTCTVTGYTTHICEYCSDRYDDEFVDALGHEFVAGEAVAPHCLSEGYTPYSCTRCGFVEYRDIVPALGHDYVQGETIAPTCTEQGYTLYICSRCNFTIQGDFVGKVPHTDEENDDGVCDVCGERLQYRITENQTIRVAVKGGSLTYIRFIPVMPGIATFTSICNSDTYAYLYDSNMRLITSNDDGGINTNFLISHRMQAGEVYYLGVRYYNSGSSGSFEVKLDYVIDCDHNTTETIPSVEPTCEEIGLTEGKVCTICGAITEAQQPVPALNHDFVEVSRKEPTETESGFIKFGCTRCGIAMTKALPATDHNFVLIDSAEPTCDKDGYVTYECVYEDCNEGYTDVISALGHEYGEWVTTKTPTCTEIGMMMSACTRCELAKAKYLDVTEHTVVIAEAKEPTCVDLGYTEGSYCIACGEVFAEQLEIKALGHVVEFIDAVAPTCTKDGSETGSYCTVCDTILQEAVVIPALGHKINTVILKEPTCTEDGLERDVCLICDEIIKDNIVIKAKDHNEVVITPAKAPSCTEMGVTECRQCSVCKLYTAKAEMIDKLPHTFDEWIETKTATCKAAGVKEAKCTVCGTTEHETIARLPHTEVVTEAKEATCTEAGNTKGVTCSVCKEEIEKLKTIEALGHNHIKDAAKSVDATCVLDGRFYSTCKRCGDIKDEVLPAKGHDEDVVPGTPADCTLGGISDFRKCKVCGEITAEPEQTPALGHDFVVDANTSTPATCTQNGLEYLNCSRCKATDQREAPATGHSFGEWEVTLQPTCNKQGEKTRTCVSCGEKEIEYIESNGSHDVQIQAAEEATCTTEGKTQGSYCVKCKDIFEVQEIIPALGHNFGEWTTEKDATCIEKGIKYRECKVCMLKETVEIESSGHKTGYIYGIDATCTTNGISDGAMCSVCGMMVTPQQLIPAKGHTDNNGDMICDRCGYTDVLSENDCDCNCHKGGISGLFFKLVLFFQKFLRMNKTCACGVEHY
jgi:hypothetical protein